MTGTSSSIDDGIAAGAPSARSTMKPCQLVERRLLGSSGHTHRDVALRDHDRDRLADLVGGQLGHPLEAVAGQRGVHHLLVDAAQPVEQRRNALGCGGYRTDRYRSSSHGVTWTR